MSDLQTYRAHKLRQLGLTWAEIAREVRANRTRISQAVQSQYGDGKPKANRSQSRAIRGTAEQHYERASR